MIGAARVVAARHCVDDDGVLEEALVLDGFEAARGEVLASVARVLDACNFCQRDFIYLDLSDQGSGGVTKQDKCSVHFGEKFLIN